MEQSSKHFPDCFHRVTIKGLCVQDGKLLLIREAESLSGKWELPGGGLDFGEDIYMGFNREVDEEMGLKISKISRAPVYVWTHKYEQRRDIDWFYSFVVCYRVTFENLNFTPTEECQEIKFFAPEEIKDLDLGGQLAELPGIFNLADFEEAF